MANTALIQDMLDNAVHIGHKRQYWSPKMRNYIYGVQNNIHVFDLYKTADFLEEIKNILKDMSEKGKTILMVGTKIQARDIVKEIAEETGNLYINQKWVPGLLTNFPTIKKRIQAYNKLEKDSESGGLDILTKKEKSQKMKELEKLKKAYAGIKDIKKTPDVLFVVDGHFEALALTEARKLGIPTVAILGSTGDIDSTQYFVPANVNSMKSIRFILNYLKDSIKRSKKAESVLGNHTEKLPSKEAVAPISQDETVSVEEAE